jgi:hypothetical protein
MTIPVYVGSETLSFRLFLPSLSAVIGVSRYSFSKKIDKLLNGCRRAVRIGDLGVMVIWVVLMRLLVTLSAIIFLLAYRR